MVENEISIVLNIRTFKHGTCVGYSSFSSDNSFFVLFQPVRWRLVVGSGGAWRRKLLC